MKARTVIAVVAVGIAVLVAGYLGFTRSSSHSLPATSEFAASAPASALPITISSAVPAELNPSGGGAPSATMQQAAAFAWQEFIALNWPAVAQTGAANTRDTPDNNCKFGDPKCSGPLVWQTFRGKVETFPGTGTPPGYPGVVPNDPSLGYDALPSYNYAAAIPSCDTPVPTGISWINLDETDQITLDSMFAGIAPTQAPGNSSPQLVRFLAKSNRTEYVYVAQNKWWSTIDSGVRTATQQYLATNMASPPAGSTQYVSLPNGTIEAKAGWRVLNAKELASGRFATANVRYYENQNNSPCYRQATFGLVALHLIQKTPTAPYFIYATFEQADNILTPSGSPVENEDGVINQPLPNCRPDQTAPCPTTPSVTLQDTAVVTPPMGGGLPPQVNLVPASAQYCTPSTSQNPTNQLYYLNSSLQSALPAKGFICVNYRDNAIPDPVIEANKTAHAAVRSYNQAQGIPDSPWLYYKLVNVQYQAIDKNYAGTYTGTDANSGHNPSSYHLANIVVETNRPLQLFSGGLLGTGSNSDYDSQFNANSTTIHKNIYYAGAQANMGGCMGCHGSQGQHQQGDFSVILARGKVRFPEAPAPVTSGGAAAVPRNRLLISK
ncbi:hypothetical protein [Granulicella sp. dw_53]|uniref:hypothetical protein n=1 Tax=Granulicella sp. dw_53 TaxID=2719792 RepID=UPI001BD2F9FE|nr:hypothetical protein [Granulicella sp. dw_53]